VFSAAHVGRVFGCVNEVEVKWKMCLGRVFVYKRTPV